MPVIPIYPVPALQTCDKHTFCFPKMEEFSAVFQDNESIDDGLEFEICDENDSSAYDSEADRKSGTRDSSVIPPKRRKVVRIESYSEGSASDIEHSEGTDDK